MLHHDARTWKAWDTWPGRDSFLPCVREPEKLLVLFRLLGKSAGDDLSALRDAAQNLVYPLERAVR